MSLKTSPFKKMLFYRDFKSYTGGHQKVVDYFEHTSASKNYKPFITFSDETLWDSSNPWLALLKGENAKFRSAFLSEYKPDEHDALFIAGLDWRRYIDSGIQSNKPVINFIQHVRHADADSDVYPFLEQRAIRICVAPEVADAIKATKKVNGPVFTIANGHQFDKPSEKKEQDVFILATKNRILGDALNTRLVEQGLKVSILDHLAPRNLVLQQMAKSRITVALPNKTEGFYLPALEAMALSDLCIVPDCVGNRGFCENNKTCLMPEYDLENILKAVMKGFSMTKPSIGYLSSSLLRRFHINSALKYHSIERERKEFFDILDNLEQIW